MKRCEWIVCESGGHWAAALRMSAARLIASDCPFRLFEVRSIGELAERLNIRPDALGLIEVQRANLDRVLVWLSDAQRSYPQARFAALLEYGLAQNVSDALLEAGAAAVTHSPRDLLHILQLGQRHGELAAASAAPLQREQPLVEWAQGLLPWQPR